MLPFGIFDMLEMSGLGIKDILSFGKYIGGELEKLKAGNYGGKYRTGMRLLARERETVTRFLYEKYSSVETGPTDAMFIGYEGGRDYESRNLPLVSKNDLLRLNNPRLKIESHYAGEKKYKSMDPKELAQEMAKWQAANLNLYNGTIYSLDTLEGTVDIGFRDTSFWEYRVSLGSLPDELAIALVDHGIDKIRKAPLPKRQKYMGSIQSLFSFHERICAGGVNVLFAAKTKSSDLALILQRRSFTVSDEPGSLTVVPKAFHEPIISLLKEHKPEDTIYRECYEELFGGDEQQSKRHISGKFYLTRCPAVNELVSRRNKNHKLIPLGVNWDLLRGNYMLNYCLFVEDPNWWEKYQHELQVNWEVDDTAEPATLISETSQLRNLIERQDWAPEAYFTFIEGLRWLANHETSAKKAKRLLPDLTLMQVTN